MKSQHLKILILLLLVSFIFFFGYKNYKQLSDKSISPFVLIPTNASIILQVNDMEDFSKNDGFIWLDGKLIKWIDATVHVLTHGLHYASSVFE